MEEIAVALLICAILALIARKVSLPPIPLYIIAGVAAANYGLEALRAEGISVFFSHLGLIFLLFYSGLEFKPGRFLSSGRNVIISGLLDLNVNVAIGLFGALILGFRPYEAFVIASAFLDTSSAIAISSLIENRKLVSQESETIVWLLIFEDLIMVFLIFFISTEVQNPLLLIVKLVSVTVLLFSIVRLAGRNIASIVQRDDELPVLFTFTAVVAAVALAIHLRIPEAVPIIALGSALSRTNPIVFERIAAPFKDIFLVVFFFFFGATISLAGDISIPLICAMSALAIASKTISGLLIGKALHHTGSAGIEIGANTVARGEFAVAVAAVFGSPAVSTTIAAMVIITSVVGVFMARYSAQMKRYLAVKV